MFFSEIQIRFLSKEPYELSKLMYIAFFSQNQFIFEFMVTEKPQISIRTTKIWSQFKYNFSNTLDTKKSLSSINWDTNLFLCVL